MTLPGYESSYAQQDVLTMSFGDHASEGAKGSAERRFAEVQKLLAELTEFMDRVTECAERGPPPTSPDGPKREQDARYEMDHLAKRYFPRRVEAKCVEDPSLAVAHGCFWRLHPAKAYAWELRLQDEIRPDFTIHEEGSDEARARFLADHPDEARAIQLKEDDRRERKARKAGADDENLALALEEAEPEAEAEEVE